MFSAIKCETRGLDDHIVLYCIIKPHYAQRDTRSQEQHQKTDKVSANQSLLMTDKQRHSQMYNSPIIMYLAHL